MQNSYPSELCWSTCKKLKCSLNCGLKYYQGKAVPKLSQNELKTDKLKRSADCDRRTHITL